MKTIIAGSRDITNPLLLEQAIKKCGWTPSLVISGGARGVDKLGEQWARDNNVVLSLFPADWGKHGRSAGMIRNRQMAEVADALIALWDGKSRGTYGMISLAQDKGLRVYIERV